jgi:TRAP transporter TAXI family solute receptor
MDKKIFYKWSLRDLAVAIGPVGLAIIILVTLAYTYIDPAPPNHLTIATGDSDETDLAQFASEYQAILKDDGVRLDIRQSDGPFQNLKMLEDDKASVDVAFVQDGLGTTTEQPDVESLGSLYYEPIWIFYRGKTALTHISQLDGKKISVGRVKHGTNVIARRLLKLNGIDVEKNPNLINLDPTSAVAALKNGEVDAAFFMLPPESAVIRDLFLTKDIHVFDDEQADGTEKINASFHHLVLSRGAIDLKNDKPDHDIDLLATTATLLIRDDLHPALQFLLLKAATQLHQQPGIFEHRGEFPANKDDVFQLSSDARQYYKSGGPFWQRYLPYWLAAWIDRFIFIVIPFLAIVLPMIKMVPRIYYWRIRQRIYKSYGELKYLETQIGPNPGINEFEDYLTRLDAIENRVNKIKVPQNFTEYIYSLRGHIQFVRDHLSRTTEKLAHAPPEKRA